MIRPILSRLLWLANSDPPHVGRQQFYAIKKRILQRWGKRVGEDCQNVTKVCYGCDGSGVGEGWRGEEGRCRRCGGDGIYRQFWCILERWELGGRIFHCPQERLYKKPAQEVTITGYISHKDPGVSANEAALWLAMVFHFRYFCTLLTASSSYGWYLWPLSNLQRVAMRLRLFWDRCKIRKCVLCGKRFCRPFERGIWFSCRECDTAEIPF